LGARAQNLGESPAPIGEQDHYINAVFFGAGSYKVNQAIADTPYLTRLIPKLVYALP
jgi:hypothetical protein